MMIFDYSSPHKIIHYISKSLVKRIKNCEMVILEEFVAINSY